MTNRAELLLAYYGDDFTGSTDALEALARAGLRAVLFLEPPSREELARFPDVDAFGVAGLTRSLGPAEMEPELRRAFAALRALGPRHVHYKVCSTFDSSPAIGSIGRAIDIGAEIFGTRCVPLLVGAPGLGRYCVFGNLFARMGIGSAGEIHRLDRHPAMRRHPITPANESDLRVHLGRQTSKRIELLDILKVSGPAEEARAALAESIARGAEVVLFDVLHAEQLGTIGDLIDSLADRTQPLFTVGSSSVETALGDAWRTLDRFVPRKEWPAVGSAEPLLVVSGSCSPVTGGQIAWAEQNGFATILLDPTAPNLAHAVSRAAAELRRGRHTVVYTSRGEAGAVAPASSLGAALGTLVRSLVEQERVRRVVVAGGDTSSYAARAMGMRAVEMIAPLGPGAPLCRAHAPGSPIDGMEVNFKGGQVGASDYFGIAARPVTLP